MGDGDISRNRAGEQQLSIGGAEPARRRRRPRPRDADPREALAGEHVPLGIGWIDEADDELVAVPLSTAWSPAPGARHPAPRAGRRWPLLRIPGEIAWPAGVGLVGLAAGVVVLSMGALPGLSGSGEPAREARPPALVSAAQVASLTAAVDPAWARRVSARVAAAAAARRREAAAKRRERTRREAPQRERERASEALPVVAAATPARISSPPSAPTDPWAGVSPMERQATPGPWNNGGST